MGWLSVIVVSVQRGVAKGHLTIAELELIHQRMLKQLATADAHLTAVYYCPHDNGLSCSCRKPAPGMLIQAAREHRVDLASSWMVGDSDIDMEAGKAAGCKTVRVLANGTLPEIVGDLTAHSLFDAAQQLIRLGQPPEVLVAIPDGFRSEPDRVCESGVTITGTNFGSSGTVTFNGTTATTSSWNSTTINATACPGQCFVGRSFCAPSRHKAEDHRASPFGNYNGATQCQLVNQPSPLRPCLL